MYRSKLCKTCFIMLNMICNFAVSKLYLLGTNLSRQQRHELTLLCHTVFKNLVNITTPVHMHLNILVSHVMCHVVCHVLEHQYTCTSRSQTMWALQRLNCFYTRNKVIVQIDIVLCHSDQGSPQLYEGE